MRACISCVHNAHDDTTHAMERHHPHTHTHTHTHMLAQGETVLTHVKTCTQIEVTDRRRPLREVPTGHVFVIGQGEKVTVEKRLSTATFYSNADRPTGGWCLCTEATRKYAWTLGLSGNIEGYLGPASAGTEVLGVETRENVIIWRNISYKACPGMYVCMYVCHCVCICVCERECVCVCVTVCVYLCVSLSLCIIHTPFTKASMCACQFSNACISSASAEYFYGSQCAAKPSNHQRHQQKKLYASIQSSPWFRMQFLVGMLTMPMQQKRLPPRIQTLCDRGMVSLRM